MEGLKSNTSEGVKIRIAKLKKTLDEIANKQTKQSVEERNYDINPIGITSDVADFLNGYGVNISIKDGQMVFEEDRGLELDLSERAIRFTNKITHLLHETTNPKPVIDSVLSL